MGQDQCYQLLRVAPAHPASSIESSILPCPCRILSSKIFTPNHINSRAGHSNRELEPELKVVPCRESGPELQGSAAWTEREELDEPRDTRVNNETQRQRPGPRSRLAEKNHLSAKDIPRRLRCCCLMGQSTGD